MLISIIIPVYNAEKFLPRCLTSIKNQTYKELEIILVNDGSSDNSGLICDNYSIKDNRFIVIHKENGGVSSARNAALKIAKGNYIGFVDPDDWVENTMFDRLLHLINDNQADMSICGFFKETEDGKILNSSNKSEIFKLDQKQAINEILSNNSIKGYLWNKLFSADIINKDNKLKFEEEIHFCEDLLFCIQYIIKAEKVIYDSSFYYHYLVHGKGVSQTNYSIKKVTALNAISKIIDLLNDKKYNESKKYINLYMHMNISLLMHGLKEKKIDKNIREKLIGNLFRYNLKNIFDKKVKISCAIARININLYYLIWKKIK